MLVFSSELTFYHQQGLRQKAMYILIRVSVLDLLQRVPINDLTLV